MYLMHTGRVQVVYTIRKCVCMGRRNLSVNAYGKLTYP